MKFIKGFRDLKNQFLDSKLHALANRRGLVDSMLAYLTKSQGSSPRPDIKTKYEKLLCPIK